MTGVAIRAQRSAALAAQRIEELERQVEQLRAIVAELQARNVALDDGLARQNPDFDGFVFDWEAPYVVEDDDDVSFYWANRDAAGL
jgi:hypothetical protein